MVTANAASISALILLALAGGFWFAVWCEYTRYASQRGGGQRLYFYAAVCAVLLLFASRLLITIANALDAIFQWCLGFSFLALLATAFEYFAGPLATAATPTFGLAFVLGPILARIVNRRLDYVARAQAVREQYGTQVEIFLDSCAVNRQLVYVGLNSDKVYVGFVTEMPHPKPELDKTKEYFTLWPQRSGYLDEQLRPQFTTQYSSTYEQILNGTITDVSLEDFEIIIPLDELVIVRTYSLDVDQAEFRMRRGFKERLWRAFE